jgi:endogenous inhibitor of DNA gyrase (YacG/DUF329 family)
VNSNNTLILAEQICTSHMALVNCPECAHPISNKAKICPNCSAPRKIELFDNNSKEKIKRPSKMVNSRKDKSLNAILFLLLGSAIMYVAHPYINKPKENPEAKYFARVERNNGIYVYINSLPIDQDSYSTIATLQVNDIQEIWKSLRIGKDNVGQVFLNALNLGNENLVFSNLINKITTQAHDKYPEATGVIINDKLTRCEIIKFQPSHE